MLLPLYPSPIPFLNPVLQFSLFSRFYQPFANPFATGPPPSVSSNFPDDPFGKPFSLLHFAKLLLGSWIFHTIPDAKPPLRLRTPFGAPNRTDFSDFLKTFSGRFFFPAPPHSPPPVFSPFPLARSDRFLLAFVSLDSLPSFFRLVLFFSGLGEVLFRRVTDLFFSLVLIMSLWHVNLSRLSFLSTLIMVCASCR